MNNPITVRVKLPEVCLPDTAFAPVPPAATCAPPAGSVATCNVSGVTCAEFSRTNSATVPGLQDVRFLVTFTLNVTILGPGGVPVCQTSQTSQFFQTVTLAAPPGTVTFCQAAFNCGPCLVVDDETCCPLEACLAVWTAPGCDP